MLFALSLLLAVSAASAQAPGGLEGHWQGTLDAGPMKLRLALHVVRAESGGLNGTLDSLDQGAMGLPIERITAEGTQVRFEVNLVGGSYEGKLSAGGTEIEGVWKQGGSSLPLTFQRVDKAPELKRPQEPSKPYPYREEEVTYPNESAGVRLAGTLTLPRSAGPHAAVVLISGSGPQDRNQAIAGHKPFLVLADRLTRQGIAVLRADDRGVGGSSGDLNTATTEDLVSDTMAALAFLITRKDIHPRRIGLIGHSEGGLIAPMAAVRSADVAFLVLMAAPGVTGEQIMYRQGELIARAMGAPETAIAQSRARQERMFALVKQEQDPAALEHKLHELLESTIAQLGGEQRQAAETAIDAQLHALTTPWFRFFLTYDPAPVLRKVRQPVLVLAGELDLQVPPDQNLPVIEKALRAAGNQQVALVRLPGLNHLLQTARTGSPLEYSQLEETMAPAALDAIARWLRQRTGAGTAPRRTGNRK